MPAARRRLPVLPRRGHEALDQTGISERVVGRPLAELGGELFTPEERSASARRSSRRAPRIRITGAALTRFGVRGEEDRWSDVDVFLGVDEDVDIDEVRAGLDGHALRGVAARSTTGTSRSGAAIYRVFLLASWAPGRRRLYAGSDFGAGGRRFRALFGSPVEQQAPRPPAVPVTSSGAAGSASSPCERRRSSGRGWEAEYWIGGARDQTLALACLRLGLSTVLRKGSRPAAAGGTAPLESCARVLGTRRKSSGAALRAVTPLPRRRDPTP